MPERPALRQVVELLSALDADLFRETGCWFAGGTAVALRCGEYRLSRDVDFLCATREGYRKLREVVFDRGLGGLFKREPKVLRPVRADRYGIRAVVEIEGAPMKLEIVSEGRIPLAGTDDGTLPVARLTDEDLVAEKLLANADRFLDDSALGRDALDLIVLQHHLGGLPESAKEKARAAYGDSIDRALARGLQRLRDDPAQLERALTTLDVTPEACALIRARLAAIPPSPSE